MSRELSYSQSSSPDRIGADQAMARFRVRQLMDRETILRYLESDRIYAAYAIGDLRPGAFGRSTWYIAECGRRLSPRRVASGDDSEREGSALCMQYRGRQPNVIFTMGHEEGVFEALHQNLKPSLALFSISPDHLKAVKSLYRTGHEENMIRMHLTAKIFSTLSSDSVFRITPNLYRELNKLYRLGSRAYFTPQDIREGVYYGIWCDGKLISIAGTHVYEPQYGIAAVGNVFTHSDYRNRGFATACTAAVSNELLKTCRDVVLNVNASNGPAIMVYTKLGYREHCRFVEVIGARRGNWFTETLIRWLVDRISRM